MKVHFELMATYNAWANARLYGAAATLSDADYRRSVGAFFGSLHGTLNHVLAADRIWLRRFTGSGEHPDRLDAILYADLAGLAAARRAEDARIIAWVAGLEVAALDDVLAYATLGGATQQQVLREVLAHFFNHQAHHRGQAHTILTLLGVTDPPPLDLLVMLRERDAH